MNTVRERPTFAHRTIIGLKRFHFRVRNGIGWSTLSITPLQYPQWIRDFERTYIASQSVANNISTPRLHALPHFHLEPINLMVSEEFMSSHLKGGFVLRCFQYLSFPNVATQQCPWQDNWYTRG